MAIPRNEYPRPNLVRGEESWINLNGKWEFCFDFGNSGRDRKLWEAPAYDHEIVVPFVPESKLSGIEYVDFINACWYRKTVTVPAGWDLEKGKVLINFGAVDYYSEVRVNGKLAGSHRGGYTPFSINATPYLTEGENVISVFAESNVRNMLQPSGKQTRIYHNHDCDYTRCTGIWQTVWMEYVPNNYIKNLKLTPDIDAGLLKILVSLEGENSGVDSVFAEAFFAGESVSAAEAKVLGKFAEFTLPIPDAKLWSIEEPNLYDLKVKAGEDEVMSYFGMRSVAINGYAIEINHKPVYQRLVLDQGYFPEGIYTAEKDEDFIRDIKMSQDVGFNGARMHMKIFEPRYIYHADRMGYILWGEYPNWGLDDSNTSALLSMMPEWLAELERDYSHPSIVGWCPFNETSLNPNRDMFACVYAATRAIDPMRPIIDTSGWAHVITPDIYDVHDYDQNPETFAKRYESLIAGEGEVHTIRSKVKYEGQPYFVSEFGGAYWNIDDDPSAAWGYGNAPKDIEEFYTRFEGLVNVLLDNPKMCALCYTQLTDVYQEKNGIYAFDRRAKFDAARLHKILTRKAAIEK